MKHCIKVDEHYIFTPATLQATYGTQFKVLSSIYAVTQVKAIPILNTPTHHRNIIISLPFRQINPRNKHI